MAPAPTTSARRPARSPPSATAASVSASETSDAPAASMPVLGVHPLADPQRLLGQLVQRPADGAGLVGCGVGGAQLAEDLRLADDHRVQPGGHREQVLHGGARVVHVDVLGQLGQRHPGVPAEHRGHVGQPAVEGVHDRVDLDRGCTWSAA